MLLVLAASGLGATSNLPLDNLNSAMNRLYNTDYPGALKILEDWERGHPADPVGHALEAADYMFSEFSRLKILESEFFEDDRKIISKKKLTYDPAVRDKFYRQITDARKIAADELAKNPDNVNALFALTISGGLLTDYTSLVEKKNIASLSYAKETQADAVRLLRIDPNYGDAYLTTGFSEYLVGSLPFFVRWFTHFDATEGNKQVAIEKLQRVAKTGQYLGPFAKLLLAIIYLREDQPEQSQTLLAELSRDYPENQLLKTELTKVTELKKGSSR
jgi:predicted Zn-dependent protease